VTATLNPQREERTIHAWLDRWPSPMIVITGIALGGTIGGAGFFYLEAPGWAVFWLALFAALGWLGYTAAPVFDEPSPKAASTRVRRVLDGPLLMVDLPGGEFLMGSPDSDDMAHDDEKPQHQVSVAPFRIAITPVTAELYRDVMAQAATAATELEARLPASDVSWFAAIEFCNRLSARAGYRPCYSRLFGRWRCDWRADGYRLPSEAEWEYACRTGGAARFCSVSANESVSAWTADNSGGHQHPVGLMLPNAWGLHDMSGNAWEWVQDCWSDNYAGAPTEGSAVQSTCNTRVLRGGAANSAVWETRSATRTNNAADYRGNLYGFRLARSVR